MTKEHNERLAIFSLEAAEWQASLCTFLLMLLGEPSACRVVGMRTPCMLCVLQIA